MGGFQILIDRGAYFNGEDVYILFSPKKDTATLESWTLIIWFLKGNQNGDHQHTGLYGLDKDGECFTVTATATNLYG
jgi:hypothetical protein